MKNKDSEKNLKKNDKSEAVIDFLIANEDKNYTSQYLSTRFGVSSEKIRVGVNRSRQNGITICSGKYGYCYTKNIHMIYATVKNINHRISSMHKAAVGMTQQTFMEKVL